MVQGRQISASVYLCVTLRNAISTSFSVRMYSFSARSLAKPDPPRACKGLASPDYSTHVLTISGHELPFVSLHHMVQNDYGFLGCMMNIFTRL